MRKTIRSGFSLAVVAALLIGVSCWAHIARAAVHTADSPPGDIAAGAWQHHKVSFNYVGFTALYTCAGLEDQVRQILLYLGARKDVHVSARGCPGPFDTPSHNASVDADFYTLAPVAGAGASDTVKARWTAFELTPRHPRFMGDGDCELTESMKDLITKNFSLREIEYRTNCYPNAFNPDSFAVKAQALRALPQTSTASRIAPVASPY
jgi:hypothetical protein